MTHGMGDDPEYLRVHQYADSANLQARIELHRRFSTSPLPFHRWLFDRLLEEGPKLRLVEAGCGPGTLWVANADRVPAGWSLTLTDLSPGMVEEARRALEASGLEAEFAVAEAAALPVPDGSADLVIANGMLYHVPDRAAALAEFRRVLRPGGALHAWTVGEAHLQELDELVRRHLSGARTGGAGAQRFGLENGAEQLRPYFSSVHREDYEDRLRITETAPLIDYIRSWGPADAAGLAAIAEEAKRTIGRDGAFVVTKSSGVFICR
jgi:ubiquinone/menaquinone biosynthesis C-methylase UbiE